MSQAMHDKKISMNLLRKSMIVIPNQQVSWLKIIVRRRLLRAEMLQWQNACGLPFHSDRIAQDSHLIPFSNSVRPYQTAHLRAHLNSSTLALFRQRRVWNSLAFSYMPYLCLILDLSSTYLALSWTCLGLYVIHFLAAVADRFFPFDSHTICMHFGTISLICNL